MLFKASMFTVPLVTEMLCTPPTKGVPLIAVILMVSPSRSLSLANMVAFKLPVVLSSAPSRAPASFTASGALLIALTLILRVPTSVRLPSVTV